MMDIYILRHGKAGQPTDGPEDQARPLTRNGRDEMKAIARWLRREDPGFTIIASSPLTRAAETAGIVARALGQEDRLEYWEELEPGGGPDAVLRRVMEHDDAAILIVGHEPALSTLIGRIVSRGSTVSIVLSKGGIARIRNVRSFAGEPVGDLKWLLTPRLISEML
jgi:phosphohistidine phosphatase